MKIPLSISEAAGLRMPVKLDWESYNVLVPSTYLMTEKNGEKMVEVLKKIRAAIDESGQTVGFVTFRPTVGVETKLRYEAAIRSTSRNPLDEEVVLFVSFGGSSRC